MRGVWILAIVTACGGGASDRAAHDEGACIGWRSVSPIDGTVFDPKTCEAACERPTANDLCCETDNEPGRLCGVHEFDGVNGVCNFSVPGDRVWWEECLDAPRPANVPHCDPIRVEITLNHGHTITIATADVLAAIDRTYSIRGTADHDHTVTITGAQFHTASIAGGVGVVTSKTNGHDHSVVIECQ